MRLPLPAQAPTWLAQVLRSIENAFREVMPGPFLLKSYTTAELPDAADFMGGLVFDSTTSTPKISTGSAWSGFGVSDGDKGDVLVSGASWTVQSYGGVVFGTAAAKNTGTSGDAVPLLNTANTWAESQAFGKSITIGSDGTLAAGSIFSNANWGMLFYAKQAAPAQADIGWFNAAGTEIGRLHATNGLYIPSSTTASAANVHQAASGTSLLRSTSSIRYKDNVETLTDARADMLLQLRPVTYNSKADADDATWRYTGLIAEEVAAIEPRLVHWVPIPEDYTLTVDPTWPKLADGTPLVPDAVQYDRLPVFMLSVLKRVRTLLSNHNQRVKALEDRLAAAKIL